MHRASRIGLMALAGLGVLSVLYLLLGDTLLGPGPAGDGAGAASGAGQGDLLASSGSAGLDASGVRPPSREEVAAKAAAEAAKARAVLKGEGVYGRVTDAQGNAIQGATVKLFADPPSLRRVTGAPDGEPIHAAVTDERGAFVVGPSPADGHAKVRAEARGYAPTVQRVNARGARVDLILDLGGRLDVRLLDEAGQAVPGAVVVHTAGTVVTSLISDEEGMARFDALPTGTGNLVVTKVGFGAVRDNDVAVAPGGAEERTLVLPKSMEIEGLVTDAATQRPIQGARVSVRYPSLPTLQTDDDTGSVTTGEDGRFRVAAHVSGQEQVIVRVRHPEYAEGRVWRNATVKGEATVSLARLGEAVVGRVVGTDRAPVAGVTVTYAWQMNEEPAEIPSTTSDKDGSFVLPLLGWATPGSSWAVVAISATGGIGTTQYNVPKEGQPRAAELEIELGGSGAVAGKVLDGGGAPVQGAVVSLAPDWNAGRSRPGRQTVPWQLMRLIHDGGHHNLTAVTGAEGTYRIPDVPALEYQVSASFGLDQATLGESIRVEAGATRQADIALGEGGTIEGWVLDGEEKPIAGAYVSARITTRRGGEIWSMSRPSARSQSDGRFVLRGVGDAEYQISVNASGYGSAQEKNVTRGTKDLVLRLTARGWIDGIVRVNGTPYRGTFTVFAWNAKTGESNPMMNRMWNQAQQTRTFNTDDGRFQIRGITAGDYVVRASTSDGLIGLDAPQVTVADGRGSREVAIELTTGAVLTGTVRDAETGQGLPNAWVYATPAAAGTNGPGPNTYTQTDAQGRYELKGLGTGAYTITVYANGSNLTRSIEVSAGERRALDITRERPGTVTFVVTDEAGKPVEGARPNIRTEAGGWVSVNVAQMRKEGLIEDRYDWRQLYNTNAQGMLVRYHVPPGTCTVWVTRNGYEQSQQATVTVRSGANTDVSVTLKKR